MTDTDTFADYLRDQGLGAKTVDLYDRIRRRWEREADDGDVLAWLLALDVETMPTRTVAPIRAAAMHWFGYKLIAHDRQRIMRRVRGRSKQRFYRHAIDQETLQLFMDAVAESAIPEPCCTILQLLPFTGLRVSEACGLQANAVRKIGKRSALTVVGKGNKERHVPIGKRARRLLSAWKKERKTLLDGEKSTWLFPSPQNPVRPVVADTVRKHLRELRDEHSLPDDLTPHTLRHYYATELLNRGADLVQIKDLLGHASITTTQLYAKSSFDALADVADLLDD